MLSSTVLLGAFYVPELFVLAAGVVLLLLRRGTLLARAMYLGIAGCAVLAVSAVIRLVWSVSLPTLVHNGVIDLGGPAVILIGVAQTAVHVVGLGLLVAAVVTWGGPTPPPSGPGCGRQGVGFVTAPTAAGESIQLVGSRPELANWNTAAALVLTATGSVWRATVNLPLNTSFEYKYIRRSSSGQVTWEYDPNRGRTTPGTCAPVTWSETWNGPGAGCPSIAATFEVNATTVWGQNVFVVGSIPALGSWNTNNAVALSSSAYPIWRATVNLPPNTSLEYKYIKKNGSTVVWESDPNRGRTTPASPCAVTYTDTWR
jgi:alpha-amylase